MRSVDPSHETIGSDIQAVIHALRHPEPIIGAEWVARLQALDPAGWYPISTVLEVLDAVFKRGGHASLLQIGRQLFRDSHQARAAPVLKSARDVVYGIDAWYHHANRGQNIGGWEVVHFGPGVGHLRKTTPHKCALEEGILHEALHIVGTDSLIVQPKCVDRGDAVCEFELRSSVRDARWGG